MLRAIIEALYRGSAERSHPREIEGEGSPTPAPTGFLEERALLVWMGQDGVFHTNVSLEQTRVLIRSVIPLIDEKLAPPEQVVREEQITASSSPAGSESSTPLSASYEME